MKQIIRLTEGDLHRIVKESVKRILREEHELDKYERADDTYTVDELTELNAIEAYYTPSDGHISVNGPEGYDDGEVEIPFRMMATFEPDYNDWWEVESIYADAVVGGNSVLTAKSSNILLDSISNL